MLRASRTVGLSLCLALLAAALVEVRAQPTDNLLRLVDSVLAAPARTHFTTLRHVLRPVRYDTAALAYMLARARTTDNCQAEAFANNYLGRIARNASDYETAVAHHDRALAVATACRDTILIAAAHNGRGVAFRRQDRIAEAVEAHEAARAITRAVDAPTDPVTFELGVAINSLGNIYLSTEQWEEAAEEFRTSMAIQEPLGNDLGMAINYHNLGYAHERMGDPDTAMRFYERSLAYNEKIDSDVGRTLCYTSMSGLHLDLGHRERALQLGRRAFALSRDLGDPFYEASARVAFGQALARSNSYLEAQRQLRSALDIAVAKGYIQESVQAYEALARLDSLRGDYLGALRLKNLGAAAERELINQKNQRIVSSLSAKLRSERQGLELERLARENEIVREESRRERYLLIAGLIAAGALAAFFFVLYRQRRITADRDRTRLEQQRLSSQMNPHFLFNALNSVKAFIIDNERTAAIRYLDAFAKLVRRILDSSINETVSLREELENCELYVRIENARLGNTVDFECRVNEKVDLDAHRVPPLVLQPFLENAFWHGLQRKTGERHLLLEVKPSDTGGVCVRVRDNGVGRAAAAAATAHRKVKRRSVGLDVTRRRLAYFANERGVDADFATRDLHAADGAPAGTEVTLRIG